MASRILSQATEKVQEMTSAKNQKIADLSTATKDVHDKNWRITSDWGTKQTNTDDWLKVSSEDKTGPMLLEDGFGREKVGHYLIAVLAQHSNIYRSTASTTSAFPSVLSTQEEQVPTELLSCLSRPQTLLRQVC